MRKSQSTRPSLAVESLEGRVVLTGGGATLSQELAAVAAAFQNFERIYASEVNTVLYRPTWTTHGSSTNPAANRAAFNNAVGAALQTLTGQLDTTLSTLPNQVASGLSTTIHADLLTQGTTNPGNLQSVLVGMATPTTGRFAPQHFTFVSNLNAHTAQVQIDAAITAAFNNAH